jgi:hypothetical protein
VGKWFVLGLKHLRSGETKKKRHRTRIVHNEPRRRIVRRASYTPAFARPWRQLRVEGPTAGGTQTVRAANGGHGKGRRRQAPSPTHLIGQELDKNWKTIGPEVANIGGKFRPGVSCK